jgi:hypothetical protein
MSAGDDRRAKSAELSAAIENHLQSGEMLGDWMVIACTVGVDDDGDAIARYHLAFSNGSMLDHHALGLLSKAEDLLVGDSAFREEDE